MKHSFRLGRLLRNLREAAKYPLWSVLAQSGPDNHFYKIARIRRIAKAHNCSTFIETGTFFGQTVAAVKESFGTIYSVELSEMLFKENCDYFSGVSSIRLFHGDSADRLGEMVDDAHGKILFWLDGHFSSGVTAHGESITPIAKELDILASKKRTNDCILIDDVRLFDGTGGYPTLASVEAAVRKIAGDYRITYDRDCLVALPPANV